MKAPFPWLCFHISVVSSVMTTEQRFWAKVYKTDSCWLWTASLRNKGYGAFSYHRDGLLIQDRAHRYSWMIHKGTIPDGKWVLHNCPDGDNPACVNPAHLFIGDAQSNVADMIAKGRQSAHQDWNAGMFSPGIAHPNARLSDDEVLLIRQHRKEGWSFGRISRDHGISIGHAFRLVNGTARKELTR